MQSAFARPFWSMLLVVVVLALGGCATLFTRSSQQVPVESVPTGAEVFVDGSFVGSTPLTLELAKRSEHVLLLRLGDREHAVTLRPGVDPTFVALDVGPGLVLAGASGLVLATTDFENIRGWAWAIPSLATVGAIVGVSSAAMNVAVDAHTGRWYRLAPGEVLVVFD